MKFDENLRAFRKQKEFFTGIPCGENECIPSEYFQMGERHGYARFEKVNRFGKPF